MFSQRSTFPRTPNRWSTARKEAEQAGKDLLDLTVSNPTRVGIPYPEDAIRSALSVPEVTCYEPDPLGPQEVRRALAARYAARGSSVDPSRIVLTASTSESYAFLFKLLTDPGDAVLVPAPGYPLFDFLGRLESVEPAPYALDPDDGWSLDVAALASTAPPRTRAVILVNPGNPTGRFLHRDEHQRLMEICCNRGWAVISDEVFGSYGLGGNPDRVCCVADGAEVLTFSLGGLSKEAGLPQVKLGWLVAGGPEEPVREALHRLEIVADSYLSVSASALRGATRLLEIGDQVRPHIRSRVQENRRTLAARLAGSPAGLEDAEGGWYGVLRLPGTRTGEEWALRLLEADGVLAHPGYFYDFPREAWLVVSLLTAPETFREGVERLVRRLEAEA